MIKKEKTKRMLNFKNNNKLLMYVKQKENMKERKHTQKL